MEAETTKTLERDAEQGATQVELQRVETACCRDRMLVVDDDEALLRLLALIFDADLPGMKIDLAHDGAEAVRSFTEAHHALVVMDLHMPVMDGRTAVQAMESLCLARRWEMPSVIFCTGFAPTGSLQSLVEGRPRRCLLRKPVTSESLVDVARSLLVHAA